MAVGLPTVTPAKTGVHVPPLDSGLRRNDGGEGMPHPSGCGGGTLKMPIFIAMTVLCAFIFLGCHTLQGVVSDLKHLLSW